MSAKGKGNHEGISEANGIECRESERRRHRRFPIIASVEAIEMQSHTTLKGRITDLGFGGCYVDTMNPFAAGTVIKIRLTKEKDTFEADAKVMFSQIGMGMGVAFISAMPPQLQIFQKWLNELAGKAFILPAMEQIRSDPVPSTHLRDVPSVGALAMIDPEQDVQVQGAGKQNLQVLVADDSLVYHKLIDEALCYQPYSLLHAKSGKEALDLFAKYSPPIVITDWMMPDLTGLELCKQIRDQSQKKYTYVILLTSMSESDSLVKGLEAGADEFLSKPFDPAELQARIGVGRRIVQLHRQVEDKNRQIHAAGRVDPLTGLPNQLSIQEWATWQLKGGAENGYAVWLVLASVDSLGQISEKWGREAGETVLKEFAQVLREKSRPSDICGRLSADKFCVMITHLSNAELATAIERYRSPFAQHHFTLGGKIVTMTASFGAIRFDGAQTRDFASLVQNADRALNSANQAGGNQCAIVSASKLAFNPQRDKC